MTTIGWIAICIICLFFGMGLGIFMMCILSISEDNEDEPGIVEWPPKVHPN
jgi:hypothetical protein